MNTIAQRLIRQTANRLGIDIHRYRPKPPALAQLSLMLAHQNVDLVLDVGANTGQFAQSLRKARYTKRIISFEPLSAAQNHLHNVSHSDPNWEIAPRVAIGDHEGKADIHIAGNSVSSSLLNMLDSHKNAAPESTYVGAEQVKISRLDNISRNYIKKGTTPFLKVDTQGYESQVLEGATNLLKKTRGLHLELSLVPLYEGQKLFDDLVQRVQTMGFSIWAINPGFCDSRTGRMLQVDVTFFRN